MTPFDERRSGGHQLPAGVPSPPGSAEPVCFGGVMAVHLRLLDVFPVKRIRSTSGV